MTMEVLGTAGREDVAYVHVADLGQGRTVEFVESVQPPIPREEKWVLIVSTMAGCPVGCSMCDAGTFYKGTLTAPEMLSQIDHLVTKRYPDRNVPARKFKVQFARMGEPTFNPEVLDVLRTLPERYHAPGLMPSLSTVGPATSMGFLRELTRIKDERFGNGRFQLQFSIHSTDKARRDALVPIRKMSFEQLASIGNEFRKEGDRKVTLNFALARDSPVDPAVLLDHFDPTNYLIKMTPLNPTYSAEKAGLTSYIDTGTESGMDESSYGIINDLRDAGYEVLMSIGELEENRIGSNCGQYVLRHRKETDSLPGAYTYSLE